MNTPVNRLIPIKLRGITYGPWRAFHHGEVSRNSHDTASVSCIRGSSHASLHSLRNRPVRCRPRWLPALEWQPSEKIHVRLPPISGGINPEVNNGYVGDECVSDDQDAGAVHSALTSGKATASSQGVASW